MSVIYYSISDVLWNVSNKTMSKIFFILIYNFRQNNIDQIIIIISNVNNIDQITLYETSVVVAYRAHIENEHKFMPDRQTKIDYTFSLYKYIYIYNM